MDDTPRGLRIATMWLDQIRATLIEPDQATIDRITAECYRERPCNDCGAPLGTPHVGDCDVARCLHHGHQRLQCDGGICDADCDSKDPYSRARHNTFHADGPHDCGQHVWDGVWSGVGECVEYGWYSFFAPNAPVSWVPCGPEHPEAAPDLNRLPFKAKWDREQCRWKVLPTRQEGSPDD